MNALQTHDKKQELIIMLLEERVKLSELMWLHGKHHSSSPSGTGSIPTKSKLFSAGLVKKLTKKDTELKKMQNPNKWIKWIGYR